MSRLKKQFITKSKQNRLHEVDIPIIGLTGGIASGKSTVSNEFEKLGCFVINADHLIKEIYTYKDTLNFISKNFPKAFYQSKVNFKILREIAFDDRHSREKLEQFLYKKMPTAFKNKIPYNCEVIIYDVPLLFEKQLDGLVDMSVCVYSPQSIQLQRLVKRDNIEIDLAEKILKAQWPIEEKKKKSDAVIVNNSDLESLKLAVHRFAEQFLEV